MSGMLGIDLGERRIGLAVADGPEAGARPLVTLPRGRTIDADAASIEALIDEHGIDELIVGLPLEAAGQEGAQAATTRAWVDALRDRIGEHVEITLRDERLTSDLAETRLGPMPRGRSGGPPTRRQRDTYRARVDREAAAIILQDELDSRRGTGPTPTRPRMESRP